MKITDIKLAEKYMAKKNNANQRSISFELSLKRFRQLMNTKKCIYTGIEFIDNHGQFGRSLDRIDANKGYTDKNTVACIISINQLKSNLNAKDIIKLANKLTKLIK